MYVLLKVQKPSAGYLQVDYGQVVPVAPAHDAVQVLQFGGEEGPESSLHPDGLSLGEALVVCSADPPHGAGVGAVQGDEVELGNTNMYSIHISFHSKTLAEM